MIKKKFILVFLQLNILLLLTGCEYPVNPYYYNINARNERDMQLSILNGRVKRVSKELESKSEALVYERSLPKNVITTDIITVAHDPNSNNEIIEEPLIIENEPRWDVYRIKDEINIWNPITVSINGEDYFCIENSPRVQVDDFVYLLNEYSLSSILCGFDFRDDIYSYSTITDEELVLQGTSLKGKGSFCIKLYKYQIPYLILEFTNKSNEIRELTSADIVISRILPCKIDIDNVFTEYHVDPDLYTQISTKDGYNKYGLYNTIYTGGFRYLDTSTVSTSLIENFTYMSIPESNIKTTGSGYEISFIHYDEKDNNTCSIAYKLTTAMTKEGLCSFIQKDYDVQPINIDSNTILIDGL